MPVAATIIITGALIWYTVGVWSERLAGVLKPWHLAFFYLGLAFDTWGTGMMFGMAQSASFNSNFHAATGLLAIVLMLAHALWATVVLMRKDERWIRSFHRLSVMVWAIWLIPYFSPFLLGMGP